LRLKTNYAAWYRNSHEVFWNTTLGRVKERLKLGSKLGDVLAVHIASL
jgi:hypothetical protein